MGSERLLIIVSGWMWFWRGPVPRIDWRLATSNVILWASDMYRTSDHGCTEYSVVSGVQCILLFSTIYSTLRQLESAGSDRSLVHMVSTDRCRIVRQVHLHYDQRTPQIWEINH